MGVGVELGGYTGLLEVFCEGGSERHFSITFPFLVTLKVYQAKVNKSSLQIIDG